MIVCGSSNPNVNTIVICIPARGKRDDEEREGKVDPRLKPTISPLRGFVDREI